MADTPQERPLVQSHDSLETQLLSLPPGDRARLAEVLLASLEGATSTDDGSGSVDAAWRAEGERRLAELRAGTVAGVPADQVFAALTTRTRR
jgi:putative addiction module component (TIGR02574 family)